MYFVNALPEALAAAAAQLESIGNSFSAENAAAAAPTTGLAPAGSDEVSLLQAGVFSTYGLLYQTVSAQAQAIHQQFVNLLGMSAGSYGETEAANQVEVSSTPLSGLRSLLGLSSATSAVSSDPLTTWATNFSNALSNSPLGSNLANLGQIQMGNWASAYSDMIGLGGGGMLTALADPADAVADLGGLGVGLDGAVAPAAAARGLGGAPVLAGVGQASSIGALSVPPSWAGAVPAASVTPATLTGAGWTAAAPSGGPVTVTPAGMPAVASSGRGGFSFGAPRYGVKPKVMPKPTVV
jgi:hypothetical protein